MNSKKIVFAVMCALLALTIILTGIVIGQAVTMFQGISDPAGPTSPTQDGTSATDGTQDPDGATQPTESIAPTDPDHEHTFTKYKTEASNCINYGYTIYKCECGETDIDNFTDPLGHSYGAGQVITSCTENGYTQYVCSRCNNVEKRNETDPTGHSFTVVKETVAATCAEDGYTVYSCANDGCTVELTEPNTGSATGHDFSIVVDSKKATCTEAGYTVHSCANDGCTEQQMTDISATGHSFGNWSGDTNTCGNCSATIRATDLKITREYESTGTSSVHYDIQVGTDEVPNVYSYMIEDHLQNGSLSWEYVHGTGLVVTYTDSMGTHTEPLEDGDIFEISADEDI